MNDLQEISLQAMERSELNLHNVQLCVQFLSHSLFRHSRYRSVNAIKRNMAMKYQFSLRPRM
jgi:hypothetical protein